MRPVLGRFGGASDLFSVDLGVHPTRVGPIRPDEIIKHPFGFSKFFENGPDPRRIQPGFDPTRSDATRVGPIWGCIRLVFGRFGGANGSDGPDPTR